MIKLLFDEDPDNEMEKYSKYKVSFMFDTGLAELRDDPYYKKTNAFSVWLSNHLEEDSYAVITDHGIWASDPEENKRLIEYGFLKEEDAILFKLTWQ